MKRWIFAALGVCCMPIHASWATNWLMMQGTEPSGGDGGAKWWGFAQVEYQKDTSDPNSSGGYVPSKMIAPEYRTQSAFNISRARIGVRGRVPDNDQTNYFLLTDFGNNGGTLGSERRQFLTDASVTFNHIPFARVRAGLFQTPGAEETMAGLQTMNYIEPTGMANFLLLERVPNSTFTANVAPADPQKTGTNLNGFTTPNSAYRDVGLQVFDTLVSGNLEFSYAAMVGNGNGTNMTDNDSHKDGYVYFSLENVYGGKDGQRDTAKLWVWGQRGKRTFDNSNDSVALNSEYDRKRNGFGVQWNVRPVRVTVEAVRAEGMLFLGPDKPTFDLDGNSATPAGDGTRGKGNGWSVEGGWRIFDSAWELDARYDVLNSLVDDPDELQFKSATLGVQYFFSPKVRFTFNATERDWRAVKFADGVSFNGNLDGIGRKYAARMTYIF